MKGAYPLRPIFLKRYRIHPVSYSKYILRHAKHDGVKKYELTAILVAEITCQYRQIHIDCIQIFIRIKMNLGPPSG